MRMVTVTVALFLAGASALAAGKTSKAKTAPACRADADCVLVTDGCCGCNEGGKQRAIPAKAREGYEKKRHAACHNTMCPALMSEDPSCVVAHAVCKEGTCGLGS
jgi:hypothetical protein